MHVNRQDQHSSEMIANLLESQSSKPINGMMFHHADSHTGTKGNDEFQGHSSLNVAPSSSSPTRPSVFCDEPRNQQQKKLPLRKGKWSDEEEVR